MDMGINMKNLFRKTRVVHDPDGKSYDVYVKKGLLSFWEYQCHFKYYLGNKRPTSSYEPQDSQEEAKEYAIKRAKLLANKTIEWESK